MAFRVGMKVVCIYAGRWDAVSAYGDEIWPVKDQVYTIRSIQDYPSHGLTGLRLAEIRNPVRNYPPNGLMEPSFLSDRFRPVVDRKTDTGMAILKKILENHEEKVRA